jgi:hypothetical protein
MENTDIQDQGIVSRGEKSTQQINNLLAPVIGIDLGTSNSVVATWQGGPESPELLSIPQVVEQGLVAREPLLPSVLYIPAQGEILPIEEGPRWLRDEEYLVGRGAKIRASLAPDRGVLSAKSWLTETKVNRTDSILPWRSPVDGSLKISPVEASRRYLTHMRSAYFEASGSQEEPEVVLTVPASFDEIARNLTLEAASQAGFKKVVLLEEPLAAFYAWIDQHGKTWRNDLKAGDIILICDIGGGTSDFSLVLVTEDDRPGHQGLIHLERISVGEHLLLGGDNMDLALANRVRERLRESGHEVDHWQFIALVSACRDAKERLLGPEANGLEQVSIAVSGRGSSLFKQTLSTAVTREDIRTVLLEGFFPKTSVYDQPLKRRVSGIQELGLRYETDPVLSRHLSRFLGRSFENAINNPPIASKIAHVLKGDQPFLLPNVVLFNGGIFNGKIFQDRVIDILEHWSKELGLNRTIEVLDSKNLDTAVAHGAAAYGKLRATGKGIRIQAGISRSYYIGLESSMPAVPGFQPPIQGLCLVAQGTNEGTRSEIPDQEFGLVVGETVDFRFFSSNIRPQDQPGNFVDHVEEKLEETSHLQATLTPQGYGEGEIIPVRLESFVTETGTLQLSLNDTKNARSWRLEFDVRESL